MQHRRGLVSEELAAKQRSLQDFWRGQFRELEVPRADCLLACDATIAGHVTHSSTVENFVRCVYQSSTLLCQRSRQTNALTLAILRSRDENTATSTRRPPPGSARSQESVGASASECARRLRALELTVEASLRPALGGVRGARLGSRRECLESWAQSAWTAHPELQRWFGLSSLYPVSSTSRPFRPARLQGGDRDPCAARLP